LPKISAATRAANEEHLRQYYGDKRQEENQGQNPYIPLSGDKHGACQSEPE
jgi:hypothetical protein